MTSIRASIVDDIDLGEYFWFFYLNFENLEILYFHVLVNVILRLKFAVFFVKIWFIRVILIRFDRFDF